jgi:hypothetical protein
MNKRQYIRIADPRLAYTGTRTMPIILSRTRNEVATWLKAARQDAKTAPQFVSLKKVGSGYFKKIGGSYDMVMPV